MMNNNWREQPRGNPEPNPRNNPIIYPQHLGYYKKRGLSPTPIVLTQQDIQNHQLDKSLIQVINNTEGGYRFNGQVVDYGNEHDHEPILRNTVVLENYVNQEKGTQDPGVKTKIFARGGPLCNFFAGNVLRMPVSTLDFDYNEEENILRLTNSTTSTGLQAEYNEYTMIGEHRLSGDQSKLVNFGFENTYRVMELITEDYELYYSKEIDGFDGDEPIEIRGVSEKWGLNGQKILYRSAAMADMKKIVVMVSDDQFLIRKVTIIDDFTRYDSSRQPVKTTFFGELNAFFEEYLPILKWFKKGQITKAGDGIAIQPSGGALSGGQNVSVVADSLDRRLWGLLKLNPSRERFIALERFLPSRNRKVFLCLTNPQTAWERLRRLDRATVLGCFVQYENLQKFRPDSPPDYSTATRFWRRIIYAVEPDLLLPLPLIREVACTFSPLFYNLPFPRNTVVSNDAPWILSSTDNLLFGQRREDIERVLIENFVSCPLPEFPRRIPMTVYCQEPCEDLLRDIFDDNITFTEPDPEEKIIFCTVIIVPEEEYRATVFRVLNLDDDLDGRPQPPSADLYLISRNDVIQKKWNNKNDLQLLDDFNDLDPIRKFPNTIALFGSEQGEWSRVSRILARSHTVEYNEPDLVYFNAI